MKFNLIQIGIGFVIFWILKKIKEKTAASQKAKKLLEKAQQTRQIRDSKLQASKKYLSELKLSPEEKQQIINQSASNLVESIKSQSQSSLQILLTFYERAITLGLETENIADLNIDEAVKQAKICDQTVQNLIQNQDAEGIKKLGLLYGLPISIKDMILIKGTESTSGNAFKCQKLPEEDGLIVKLLKDEGAIPFIKTNLPQNVFINESYCRMWGRALNPWDKKRTVGGSSGGEAGLIALKGSPLGIGTDIGGSIRIPCLYCGLYGFKPTSTRISWNGNMSLEPDDGPCGQINVLPVTGPLGKNTDDLILVMRSFLTEKMWQDDPYIPRIPFQEEDLRTNRKLKIGYLVSDDEFKASEANQRAVKMAAEALKKLGHEVIEVKFPNLKELAYTYCEINTAQENFGNLLEPLQGEPVIDDYKLIVFASTIPRFARPFMKFIHEKFLGEKRLGEIIGRSYNKTAGEYVKLTGYQLKLQKEFFEFWKNLQLDGMISPGLGLPAILHKTGSDLIAFISYSFIWNLLNYPTGAIPITKVQENEQFYEDPNHKDQFTRLAKECMKNSAGLPVGVQVSTLPYKEELCLNIMKQIESQIQFYEYPNYQ